MSTERDEPRFKVECIFGISKLETRLRREGNTLVGEGRRIDITDDGVATIGPWEPSGCVMHVWDEWPEQPKQKGLAGFVDRFWCRIVGGQS